jgi:acyl-coenzyme A thioesterase 9
MNARSVRPLLHASSRCQVRPIRRIYDCTGRSFHVSACSKTDGVFAALSEMRTKTPWVEAFRQKQREDEQGSKAGRQDNVPEERDLTPKKMSDSHHSVVLPLAQDPWLLDTYLNATGHIRWGTIFMDLDALSGVIAYKHTGEGVSTVTAAVDRITIKHPLNDICDLELSGMVTFATGRSSMEISIQVARAPPAGQKAQPEDVVLECAFTMVALDPRTKKPVNVPALQLDTEEEKQLFEAGKENYNKKKALAKTTLRKTTPNQEEAQQIHQMWIKDLDYNGKSLHNLSLNPC